MIIDSHIHAVAADTVQYPLSRAPIGLASQHASRAGLRRAGRGGGPPGRAGQASVVPIHNAYAVDSAAAARDRFVSVCTVDPLARDAADACPCGSRSAARSGWSAWDASGLPFNDPRIAALMRQGAKLNISVCVLTQFRGLVTLPDLLAQHPHVPVAIDHMGFPPIDQALLDLLLGLAQFPNLFLKFSSLTLRATARPKTFLRRIIDHSARTGWYGTPNFPASAQEPLREQLARARAALDFLTEPDRRAIFGDTAARLGRPHPQFQHGTVHDTDYLGHSQHREDRRRKKVIPGMLQGQRGIIAAIASRDVRRAREAATALDLPHAYGSYEEPLAIPLLMQSIIPCRNHFCASPWTIKALEAGKHMCAKSRSPSPHRRPRP